MASVVLFALVLWVKQGGARTDFSEWAVHSRYIPARHARYTLRADDAGFTLYGPPPPRPGTPAGHAMAARVRQLDDGQIEWGFWWWLTERELQELYVNHDQADEWQRLWYGIIYADRRHEAVPPLLDALEDPSRFVAAHMILCRLATRSSQPWWRQPRVAEPTYRNPPTQPVSYHHWAGLTVRLSEHRRTGSGVAAGGPIDIYRSVAWADPAQFPALRARWHRTLDVPVYSVGYNAILAATAAIAALRLVAGARRAWVQRSRVRRGLCVHCGYDLRASSGACSECGAVATLPKPLRDQARG